MTDKYFNELKQASKNKPSFQVLINGEWKVCDDISILPYKNTTLGIHLDGMDSFYKDSNNENVDAINVSYPIDIQKRLGTWIDNKGGVRNIITPLTDANGNTIILGYVVIEQPSQLSY